MAYRRNNRNNRKRSSRKYHQGGGVSHTHWRASFNPNLTNPNAPGWEGYDGPAFLYGGDDIIYSGVDWHDTPPRPINTDRSCPPGQHMMPDGTCMLDSEMNGENNGRRNMTRRRKTNRYARGGSMMGNGTARSMSGNRPLQRTPHQIGQSSHQHDLRNAREATNTNTTTQGYYDSNYPGGYDATQHDHTWSGGPHIDKSGADRGMHTHQSNWHEVYNPDTGLMAWRHRHHTGDFDGQGEGENWQSHKSPGFHHDLQGGTNDIHWHKQNLGAEYEVGYDPAMFYNFYNHHNMHPDWNHDHGEHEGAVSYGTTHLVPNTTPHSHTSQTQQQQRYKRGGSVGRRKFHQGGRPHSHPHTGPRHNRMSTYGTGGRISNGNGAGMQSNKWLTKRTATGERRQ